jgi:putative flippase GtrA
MTRFLRFNLVGAGGIAVQLGMIWLLAHRLAMPPGLSTAVGVGAAVLHNYLWHRAWTWRDRPRATSGAIEFLMFAGANGLVSLVGNVMVVTALTSVTRIGAAPGSLVGIAICGLVNYWLADRAVFAARPEPASVAERAATGHARASADGAAG